MLRELTRQIGVDRKPSSQCSDWHRRNRGRPERAKQEGTLGPGKMVGRWTMGLGTSGSVGGGSRVQTCRKVLLLECLGTEQRQSGLEVNPSLLAV